MGWAVFQVIYKSVEMARPTKATVEYFPHYAKYGKTLTILQNRFGNDGYAVWFKTLEQLAGAENHYINLQSDVDLEVYAITMGVSKEFLYTIMELLSTLKAIDQKLWEKRIIWSQNFVDNLADLYKRRIVSVPIKPVIDDINEVNVYGNPEKCNSNPQSKVKERKGKKEKIYKKEKFGEFVKLIKEQYNSLVDDYGKDVVDDTIDSINNWVPNNREYKDYNAALRNWLKKDHPKQKSPFANIRALK